MCWGDCSYEDTIGGSNPDCRIDLKNERPDVVVTNGEGFLKERLERTCYDHGHGCIGRGLPIILTTFNAFPVFLLEDSTFFQIRRFNVASVY